jgi:acetyl-CoA carboxylase biotin carboxyl carrier protein
MDHEDVEEILALLDATPLQHFELETDRFKVTLRRGAGGDWTQEYQARRTAGDGSVAKLTPAGEEASAAADTASAPGNAPAPMSIGAREIRAPLIGTFHRSPKPGAPPFVEQGTRVGTDTVVAIVETMKLMTSIYAGCSGRIAEILLDDGQFVEQEQLLMRVVSDAP